MNPEAYCQSYYIYGIESNGDFQPANLVRLNYLNGNYDTLLYLGPQYLEDFGTCIDPFNGRLFVMGFISGQSGNLNIIDLENLDIESFDVYDGEEIEYNFLNNSIIYHADGYFWKFDLNNHVLTNLSSTPPEYATFCGKLSVYNPTNNTYTYIMPFDGKGQNVVTVDAFSGHVLSIQDISMALNDIVVDFDSGEMFGRHNGTIYRLYPEEGLYMPLVTIPNYYSLLNTQMAVYDQVQKKYIVPYIISNNYAGKIAVIDMINFEIDTIYNQPCDRMNKHQVYCKPKTYLSLIVDTLFTSYGLNYSWFINGYLNPIILTQSYAPLNQGVYQTLVEYPAYSSVSDPVSYLFVNNPDVSRLNNEIKIFPNPTTKNITITLVSNPKLNLEGSILSSIGLKVKSFLLKSEKTHLDVSDLDNGLYFISIIDNMKIYQGKFIKN